LFISAYVGAWVPYLGCILPEAVGPSLQIVELGSSYDVTIQITTPHDLARVVVEDFGATDLPNREWPQARGKQNVVRTRPNGQDVIL